MKRRVGPALRIVLLVLLAVAFVFVAWEDSDGVTLHDFFDTTALHHEHFLLMIGTLAVLTAAYPTKRERELHVHATAIALVLGSLLVSAALINLPDNISFLGGPGVSGYNSYLGGTVANLSNSRQFLPGVTVNYTLTRLGLAFTGQATTNKNGSFLVFIPTGPYTLKLNKSGYQAETAGVNVLPLRGSHFLFFLAPMTYRYGSPPPVNNTNATNVPSPAPPPSGVFRTALCLIFTTHYTTNGSVYQTCVVSMGPLSQTAVVLGLIVMAAAVIVRAVLERRKKRR